MSLCWSCNPLCGTCTPATMVGVTCPQCGKVNVFTCQVTPNPQTRLCATCKADLTWETVPRPKFCNRQGQVCGNPCGQASQEVKEKSDVEECPSWTEPFDRPA